MTHDLDPLILDLVEWIDREPRSHAEVIDVWRTSCPRLTVWEDAMDRGFAVRDRKPGRETMVRLTARGLGFLRAHGRITNATTDAARSGPPFASGRIAAPVLACAI